MMIEPERLKSFLDALVKDTALKMKPDGTTFCNVGLHRGAQLYGEKCFDKIVEGKIEPMTAREAIAFIESSNDKFLIVNGNQAADYARRGGLAVSYMKIMLIALDGKPSTVRAAHDHVALVYPAALAESGSLGHPVPLVGNIGKKNGVMKSSEAYPVAQGEASYAILV